MPRIENSDKFHPTTNGDGANLEDSGAQVPEQPPVTHVGLNTRRLSDVKRQPIRWLWWQRFLIGKLALVSGDPDLGKSWLVLDMMARITTGRDMPDGSPNPYNGQPREVLWASAEDDDTDTISLRFEMLGGDPNLFHSITCVGVSDGHGSIVGHVLSLQTHLTELDEYLEAHPAIVMVALDPFDAFLGLLDTHRNANVQQMLTPVKELAARRMVCICGINHLNKSEDKKAMYRSNGSIAFMAKSRASWLVTEDPEEPKFRRFFTKVKVNDQTEDVGGLAFKVKDRTHGIVWDGKVDMTADEALAALRPTRPGSATQSRIEVVKEWVLKLFTDGVGSVPSKDVDSRAKRDRICRATLFKAKKELGVKSRLVVGEEEEHWEWVAPVSACEEDMNVSTEEDNAELPEPLDS